MSFIHEKQSKPVQVEANRPMTYSANDIYLWLEEVKDPEIPVLSLVDLGIITEVQVENEKVTIEITPTFVGCPALEMMKSEIKEKLGHKGISNVEVLVSFRKSWSSDKISEKGRRALKTFGLAPPPLNQSFLDLEVIEHAVCPRCESTNTEIKNIFGSTLCRSIHFCCDCKETFEQFKPI
jgi:ring-1,2-phenylacetyl-CoA epoxidase subunit PaaD